MAKVTLFNYQSAVLSWMLKRDRGLLFLDCGLGKTLITLSWLWMNKDKAKKTLIIAPPLVAKHTWTDEIAKWGITKLRAVKVLGPPDRRKKQLAKEAEIYIATSDSIKWIVAEGYAFDCIVVDEISKFKSYNSQRFKALQKLQTRYFWGLTGTPCPRDLTQLWPQATLVQPGILERNITAFRYRYCTPRTTSWGIDWEFHPLAGAAIRAKMSQVSISMEARRDLMPDVVYSNTTVYMSKREQDMYKQFKEDLVLSIEDDKVLAGSLGVLANKLGQMANGFLYGEDKVFDIHSQKLDRLEEMLETIETPVLLFYKYKEDLARITKRLPSVESTLDIDRWNRGKIKVLALHPASAGHGLNLQAGGNIIIWYGMPWDLELYIQANARVARTGQKNAVSIIHLLTAGTIEDRIKKVLSSKKDNQDQVLEAVRAELFEK